MSDTTPPAVIYGICKLIDDAWRQLDKAFYLNESDLYCDLDTLRWLGKKKGSQFLPVKYTPEVMPEQEKARAK